MSLWSKIKDGLSSIGSGIVSVAKKVGSGISSAASSIVSGITSFASGNIIGGVTSVVNGVGNFVSGFSSSEKTSTNQQETIVNIEPVNTENNNLVARTLGWVKYDNDTNVLRG